VTASRWTDDELISLQNAYDRDVNGHDDVVTLIRGARAVVALHAPVGPGHIECAACVDTSDWLYPCATIRALNLEV